MASRQTELTHPVWGGREGDLMPLCRAANSDSASLDNTAELLVRTGDGIDKALMMLVPEAYQNHPDLDAKYPHVKDFYRCARAGGQLLDRNVFVDVPPNDCLYFFTNLCCWGQFQMFLRAVDPTCVQSRQHACRHLPVILWNRGDRAVRRCA